jgi:uncharacterized membrane protein YheB (UPF0754 family)
MNVLAIAVFLPIVGAIIGWTTKWAALKLVFKPEKRVGIGPIGWQGIVIRRSEKFAAGIAETMSGSVLDLDEMFGRIDSGELAELITPALEARADDLARAALDAVRPGLWEELALDARSSVAELLVAQSGALIPGVVEELKPAVQDAIDIEDLVVPLLSGPNARRLSRLLQAVGSHELRWMIWYGAVMGFFIGAVEVGFYVSLERWWLLPIVGAVDGLVNNWLAIQMIFLPRERKKYLGVFPYQGMFPARQAEISRNYAAMIADEVLTAETVADMLARNGGAAAIGQAATQAVRDRLAPHIALLAALGGVEDTPALLDGVMAAVVATAGDALAEVRPIIEDRVMKRLEIAATIEQRLAALPKDEFETILRNIFREDEGTLIALGGVLGTLIGLVQAGIVVSTGLGG